LDRAVTTGGEARGKGTAPQERQAIVEIVEKRPKVNPPKRQLSRGKQAASMEGQIT
jgi:hypothetical protein